MRRRRLAQLLILLQFLAIGALLARQRPDAAPREITPRGPLPDDEQSTIRLFKDSSQSVVHITTLARQRDLFSFNIQEIPQGTGSGFVWDTQGHIVTNFHVIQGAQAARVTLSNHASYDATLVGYEADKDLAVLRIDAPAKDLRPIPLGASKDLAVGQKVYAIGNPFGLDQSLSTGIISALGREIESVTGRPLRGVIQTDAVINPGNSGGPLLDSAGRLIGINTAIYSPTGASVGIGFAVPVDSVNQLVPQLIAFGKIERPSLGLRLAEDRWSLELGIEGLLVLGVPEGSAAEKAGIRPTTQDWRGRIQLGDVLTAIDGRPIHDSNDLYRILDDHKIGDSVELTLLRPEGSIQIPLVLLQEAPTRDR